ncbi:MAG: zinc-ribbon domain-containing protein [Gemmataceae bacterium]|nr:zinc-ribbon domain-containing protein [Gemmataceae bacterium]
MPITITCPKCSQMCAVQDEHAGMTVQCPKCQAAIVVPVQAAPAASAAPIEAQPAAGPGFMAKVSQAAQEYGVDGMTKNMLFGVLGGFGLMFISTLLPWISVSVDIGPLGGASATMMGLRVFEGILIFLMSLGAGGFLATLFFFVKNRQLFDISLWVALGCSAFSVLLCLIFLIRAGNYGFGFFLCLLAALGTAGAMGFIGYNRFLKKK